MNLPLLIGTRLCALFSVIFAMTTFADTKEFSSRSAPVQFLELYSSQGCYSCPPAERWINHLSAREDLWSTLIPVNLHVDYWDYLGWKDPFSFAEFSSRQRKYARLGHTSNVATPGFVVNGKGWRGWFVRGQIPAASVMSGGVLKARLNQQNLAIDYRASGNNTKRLNVHVAVLGFGITTRIPKGENAGKTLAHDFVVVGYQRAPLSGQGALKSKELSMPRVVDVPMSKQALVLWVTANDDPSPVQVAADWL